MGCNGGLQDNAYKYYEANHYAIEEANYRYTSGTSKKSGKCQYDTA